MQRFARTAGLRTSRFSPRVAARAVSSAAREPATEAQFPSLKFQTKLFINNRFVDSVSGKTFDAINPGNGEVLAKVAEAQKADVDIAVKAAHEAFSNGPWRKMTPRERGAMLYKLSELISQNVTELAQIEALNNGKTFSQATVVDAPACARSFKYYAGWADKLAGKTVPIGENHFCYTIHEPVGVVGLIVPWNLPLIAVAAKIAPALTCGNTVVLKTAEQTPLSALRLAELVAEAGFPPGVINIISGDGPTAGQALTQHPLIDKVSFTGSVEVGRRVQAACAASIKRVTLELGGKNPVIVCDDADLDIAVEQVHNGLFWNDGEACASGSRIFVQDSIYDEFVRRSVERAAKRKVGNPFDPTSNQGAQVSEEQLLKIMGYIQSAKDQGARLQLGGNRVGTKGFYLEPTVFSELTDDMTCFKEEIFGPVMCLSRFSSVEEVLRRANDTPFGLAAGVFTKDVKKGNQLTRGLRSGMVFWNCYHVVDISAPFGGMKQSGFGREGGGEYGLMPYMEVKMVAQHVAA